MTSDSDNTGGEPQAAAQQPDAPPDVQPDAAAPAQAEIEDGAPAAAQPDVEPEARTAAAIEVQIEKWVYGGAGLARESGKVLLIPYTLPGERVRVEIARDHGGFAEARVQELVERSPERVEPPCPVFGRCGGCHYQHATAEFQAARKAEMAREVLRRVGKLEAPAEIGILAAEPWGYRNRTQFHTDGREIGFLEAGSHRLVAVDDCPISAPRINESLDALRYMLRDRGWPRFVRSIELFTNGTETMVNVLETEGGRGVAKGFFEWLAKQIEGAARGGIDYPAAGETYRVSHGAFFQVNRFLVDALAERAVEGAEGRAALDLYSGVGLFAVRLARRFGAVAAVESNHQAARELARNAERAGVKVEVHAMQAEQYLATLQAAPEFVLADPPRSGLGKHVVEHLVRLRPAEVRVVSCDPATLARDAAGLVAGGYRLEKLTMADLFPQTYHIETIAAFRRG
ncbi:MAG: class I SAM-dependent RNA methyltransferase [Bryobacteraceae bacterium]